MRAWALTRENTVYVDFNQSEECYIFLFLHRACVAHLLHLYVAFNQSEECYIFLFLHRAGVAHLLHLGTLGTPKMGGGRVCEHGHLPRRIRYM